jgi:CheY-like chemotaxis protein
MGRRSLRDGEGLLLQPAPAIHTAFMRFPIDALFLDPDLQVLDIVERLRPWHMAGKRNARAVLEIGAGEAARRSVRIGDQLGVLDVPLVPLAGDGDQDGEDQIWRWFSSPETELAAPFHSVPPFENGAQGTGTLRVLVIAHDRRFRTVASALLERRGCVVATSPSANRVVELVAGQRADVVVIDAGALLTAAARTVAAVAALDPPVGVVLVADEAENGLQHMPVLAKWGPFEEFFAAIERAGQERGHRSRLVG